MAVDIIQPREGQEAISRVLQSICGNTLITEGVEAARQLAFDGPQRHKVGRWASADALCPTALRAHAWESRRAATSAGTAMPTFSSHAALPLTASS